MPQPTRRELLKRWRLVLEDRDSYLPHWRELAAHIHPRGLRDESQRDRDTSNDKLNGSVINATPLFGRRTLAAGMMAGITSPSRPWYRLTTSDPGLAELDSSKRYLSECESATREQISKSNFYDASHVGYEALITFGTTCVYIEEADVSPHFHCYAWPVGSFALTQDARQKANGAYHRVGMPVHGVVKEFGYEKCSASVRRAHDERNWDRWVNVAHVIEENEDFVEDALGDIGKRFSSYWFDLDDGDGGYLRTGGYHEFPVLAPRWSVTGEDRYGSSPGYDALGDCKALQHLEKRKAMLIDKIVDPPMKGPSSLIGTTLSLLPGDFTGIDSPTGTFEPVYMPPPLALGAILADIKEKERLIDQAFFADLWLMLSRSDTAMTAREVIERREEKLLQLGTVLERLQNEFLDPFIARVFAILERAGLLPEPPAELQGREVKVEYLSIMAQAQKMLGTVALERLVQFVMTAAPQVTPILDKLDWDQTVDELANMLGVPPKVVRPDDEVETMRAQRAKQAQQQQQLAMQQQGAETAKTLAQAPTGEPNALSALLRTVGAA